MPTVMGTICRAAHRTDKGRLNVLTFPTHERYQGCQALTGHNFYLLRGSGIKDWNARYAPLPPNVVLLDPSRGSDQIPRHLDFDVVLSQNKFGQYDVARQLSAQLHLPLVSLEHTLPPPSWGPARTRLVAAQRGHVNVFISEYSRAAWGHDEGSMVIHHGVDTEFFKPGEGPREAVALSVVNDWVNRDWCMPAGQKILTSRGYVPIEKVGAGMEVLTDDGTPHPVTRTFSRDYFGDMVLVKFDRDTEVRFTPNHAVRVFRDGQWKYVEASRLRRGDTLKFPDHIQTDYSFGGEEESWLLGLIVGDGSITNCGGLSIAFNENERANAERALAILRRWIGHGAISERHRSRGAKAISVDATSRVFCNWLKQHIGGKAGEKRLPDFIMRGSLPVRLAALRGLWAADGSFKNGESRSARACYSTISPCLAAQASELLHSFGVKCSVRRFKRTTNKSSGRVVPIYRVVAYGVENVDCCRRVICDAGWRAVSLGYRYIVQEVDIEQEWAGKVYNCEVAHDHSYVVAPGFVAHNCCGFKLWEEGTRGLPVKVLGDTPGLSKAAGPGELAAAYRKSLVFVNTSLVSPVPTALLEAMASGCAVVTTCNCMIGEVVKDGENGLHANTPQEVRRAVTALLADPVLAARLGGAARKTVEEKFSLRAFVAAWDLLLREAADFVYTGGPC